MLYDVSVYVEDEVLHTEELRVDTLGKLKRQCTKIGNSIPEFKEISDYSYITWAGRSKYSTDLDQTYTKYLTARRKFVHYSHNVIRAKIVARPRVLDYIYAKKHIDSCIFNFEKGLKEFNGTSMGEKYVTEPEIIALIPNITEDKITDFINEMKEAQEQLKETIEKMEA